LLDEVGVTHQYPICRESAGVILTDNDPLRKKEWKNFQMHKHSVVRHRFPPLSDCAQSYLSITGGPYYVQQSKAYTPRKRTDPEFGYWDETLRTTWGPLGAHILGHQPLTEVQADGGFVPKPTNLGWLLDQAFLNMLPTIKTEVSSINSIIELKDFASLPRTIANVLSFTKKLSLSAKKRITSLGGDSSLGSIRRSFSKDHGPTLREATNQTADVYLQSQFNVLPFISDVCGFRDALLALHKKVNRLLSGQGKRQIRHYNRRINLLTPADSTVQESSVYRLNGHEQFVGQTPGSFPGIEFQPYTTWFARRWISGHQGRFHAQIEYDYSYNSFQIEYATILTFLDMIGVNLNPAILWNAIPWSFAVDWVLGLGRWLDQRKSMNMEPKVNIRRFLWSWDVRRQTELELVCFNQPAVEAHWPPPVALPPCLERCYRRDVGVPTYNSQITSGLDSHELSLSAALLVPRVWRPTRALSPRVKKGTKFPFKTKRSTNAR
jgi:hypothetical protein